MKIINSKNVNTVQKFRPIFFIEKSVEIFVANNPKNKTKSPNDQKIAIEAKPAWSWIPGA